MSKAIHKIFSKKTLILIVFIQAIYISLFFAFNKEGYHSDEIWNYAFANSSEYKHIYTLDDRNLNNCLEWKDSKILLDYISVDESEIFSYKPIYENASSDLNPPLHYMLLHFICSFFPNVWSKWFCFIINIISFIIGQFYLYKLTEDVSKSSVTAYSGIILYGLGMGIINITSFLRIYAMGVCFTIMFLYYSNKVFELRRESKKQNKYIIISAIVCLLGAMTVHLFLTIAFIIVFMYSVYYLFSKNIKLLFKYGLSMSLSVLISIMLFPTSMTHLSITSTSSQVKKYPTLWQFKIYLSYLTKDVSGIHISAMPTMTLSYIKLAIIILLLLFIPFSFIARNEAWFKNIKERAKNKFKLLFYNIKKLPYLIILLFVSIMFFIYISAKNSSVFKMGKYSRRYIFFLYPLFAILIVLCIHYVILFFTKNKKLHNILILAVSFICASLTYVYSSDYFSMRHQSVGITFDDIEKDANCILAFNEIWLMTCATNEFYDTNSFYATRYKDYRQNNYSENLDTSKPLYLILDAETISDSDNVNKEIAEINFEDFPYGIYDFDQKNNILEYYKNLPISTKLEFVGIDVLFNRTFEIYKLN